VCDGNDADTAAPRNSKTTVRRGTFFEPLRFPTDSPKNFKFLGDATRNHPRERMALRFLAYGSSLPSRNEHGDLAVFVA